MPVSSKKNPWLVAVLLCLFYWAFALPCQAAAPGRAEEKADKKPLIIYYSLTGTTKTIAEEISRTLSCDTEEIRSQKLRQCLGKLTCVNDQLFDRDDALAPVAADLSQHSRLIIATPVWIHALASPMRTLIKYHGLKNKQVWLVLTNRGNYGPEDEKNIKDFLHDRGITVLGLYAACTEGRSEQELRLEGQRIAHDIGGFGTSENREKEIFGK